MAVGMVVEMIATRHLSRVIHLTPFAKNDGETDILCRVCLEAGDFFSLVEPIGVFRCF